MLHGRDFILNIDFLKCNGHNISDLQNAEAKWEANITEGLPNDRSDLPHSLPIGTF